MVKLWQAASLRLAARHESDDVLVQAAGHAVVAWLAQDAPTPGALLGAYYREFVQLERRKKNGQFGANRTVVSMMPNGVVAAAMPCEAMSLSMVIRLG